MHLSLGFLSLVALAVSAQDRSTKTVKKAFEDAKLPEDLTINFNPTALLEVSFPQSHGHPNTLYAGKHLPIAATVGPPMFGVSDTSCRGPFVITALDPDAPTPQNRSWSEVRHFVGANFHRDEHTGKLTNSTPALSEFVQPAPPSGTHRYTFLLFKQPDGFNDQRLFAPNSSILNFNVSTFAQQGGLGDPIAGTFMLVAPDSESCSSED